MNRLPLIVFIMFTVFSHNAFCLMGQALETMMDTISRLSTGTTRAVMRKPSDSKIMETLDKIETRLDFSDDVRSPSMNDMKDLANARFNPFKDKAIKEAYDNEDMETFRTALFEYVKKHHLDSPIVLRWWDLSSDFRNTVFPLLNKDHLSNPQNPELLLKWYDKAVSRGTQDQLDLFIKQGFEEMDLAPFEYFSVVDRLGTDPFILTVFKGLNEYQGFSDHVGRVLVEIDQGYH